MPLPQTVDLATVILQILVFVDGDVTAAACVCRVFFEASRMLRVIRLLSPRRIPYGLVGGALLRELQVVGMFRSNDYDGDWLDRVVAKVAGINKLDLIDCRLKHWQLPTLATLTGLVSLDISGSYLGGGGLNVLSTLSKLQSLVLSRCQINEDAGLGVPDLLRCMTGLESLDVGDNSYMALNWGVDDLDGVVFSGLRRLNLGCTCPQDDMVESIAGRLATASQLERLSVNHLGSHPVVLGILRNVGNGSHLMLANIHLSGCQIGKSPGDINALAAALERCPLAKVLDLSFNPLTAPEDDNGEWAQGLRAIGAAIGGMRELDGLCLRRVCERDSGLHLGMICGQAPPTLKYIDLSDNRIGRVDTNQMDWMTSLHGLGYLGLGSNRHDCGMNLHFLTGLTKLNILDLSGSGPLDPLLLAQGGLNYLGFMPALLELSMSSCGITEASAPFVANAISPLHPQLQKLDLSSNPLGQGGLQRMGLTRFMSLTALNIKSIGLGIRNVTGAYLALGGLPPQSIEAEVEDNGGFYFVKILGDALAGKPRTTPPAPVEGEGEPTDGHA